MEILSRFDTVLIIVMITLSIIGLIRGFLKELASIINWFGSVCCTVLLKPILIRYFLSSFRFPFLVDLIANAILFITFVIVLSIVNKIIVEKIQSFIPYSTNSSLGFLFGFVKSIIIVGLFLGCFNIVFRDSSDILNSSIINRMLIKDTKLFSNIVDVLFGNYIEEKKNNINSIKNTIENTTNSINDKMELIDKIDELTNFSKGKKKTINEITINNKRYKIKKESDFNIDNNGSKNSSENGNIDNIIDSIIHE